MASFREAGVATDLATLMQVNDISDEIFKAASFFFPFQAVNWLIPEKSGRDMPSRSRARCPSRFSLLKFPQKYPFGTRRKPTA